VRALVLGAGAVGTKVAQQLLSSNTVDKILLRDIAPEKLGIASKTLGSRVEVEHFPFPQNMDADVVVVASPRGTQLEAVKKAISLRRPTVVVSDGLSETVSILNLEKEAFELGVPVVVGTGFAPGLSCVLSAYGKTLLEQTEEIHVSKMGTGGPACALVHHRALSRMSFGWREDKWDKRLGGSGRELLWFPEPVGPQDCYHAALSDPILLHNAFPDVSRISAKMAATRRDRFTAFFPMLTPPHNEGGIGAIRVELRGNKNGVQENIVLGVSEHPASAAAAVTALTTEYLLKQKINLNYMSTLALIVEPSEFLSELTKRSIAVEIFEGDKTTV
jgi:saccharopine dehydrogenase-like NADP-dependent oxidoreductase|tara:strand:- start:2586 stop:3581 length:996 start_codon:yes stop_codon:yes gene_type:complete